MTSKRFSFKNLIFVFTLAILAIAFCVAGGNGIVLADSRSDAKNDINNSYTAIISRTYGSDVLVDENNYNAQKVLDKIKFFFSKMHHIDSKGEIIYFALILKALFTS